MIKRGNSKGLSTVVATLLIVLLVLVAVAIIWVVLRNVLEDSAEQVSFGRFTVDLDITKADIINDTAISVIVKRNSGQGEIYGILFVVYDDENSEVVRETVQLKQLEERGFNIILFVLNTSNAKKVSIAPIFILESGKEFIGDIEDEWIFIDDNLAGGCTYSSQCNDYNPCTTDACSGGTCTHNPIACGTNNDNCCPTGCTPIDDNDCSSEPVPETWTSELISDGGFESGNLNAWNSVADFYVTTTNPQSGTYAAYYQSAGGVNNYIRQDIDLATTYGSYISAGDARINASGYLTSLSANDLTRIQFIFLDSGGSQIGSPALDTGYNSYPGWSEVEVVNYEVPSNAVTLRVWANTYDSAAGPDSGSIDSFSVRLGYF